MKIELYIFYGICTMAVFDSRDFHSAIASAIYGEAGNDNSEYKYQLHLIMQMYSNWLFMSYHMFLLTGLVIFMMSPIYGIQSFMITFMLGFLSMCIILMGKCERIKKILDSHK